MKAALAQINCVVGDLRGNADRVVDAHRRAARRGADLVVYPEQTLGGYPALDLWEERGFGEANEKALASLARRLSGPAALVGFVSRNRTRTGKPVRNSVAWIDGGKVVAVRHKTLLPTYDVFDEARYFEPATDNAPVRWRGRRWGVSICEDAWARDSSTRGQYRADPLAAQAKAGAQVLLNLSASPYVHGKSAQRRRLLAEHTRRLKLPLLYCNSVGANDELIFDGGSLAYDGRGRLRARAAFAAEDLLIVDIDDWSGATLATEPDEVGLTAEALNLGIHDFAAKCGLGVAYLGLSGGVDSAVTAALAVRALGPARVVGVSMPSEFSSPGSVTDAQALADNLGIQMITVPIAAPYRALLATLGKGWGNGIPDIAEQNLQARVRGTLLMALANRADRGFVLSTGNKSELAVGYCTLYGDMCGALAPLADAPKRLVYALAVWLNRDREVIPVETISKPPSAELKPGQTDQDDLPPYDQIDDALEAWVQQRSTPRQIARVVGDRVVAQTLLDRMDRSEFKRRQAAPALKISIKAFGIGRRMPIAKAAWRARI
jgi:NAD+ synthetase